jgi:hypothetical protein
VNAPKHQGAYYQAAQQHCIDALGDVMDRQALGGVSLTHFYRQWAMDEESTARPREPNHSANEGDLLALNAQRLASRFLKEPFCPVMIL